MTSEVSSRVKKEEKKAKVVAPSMELSLCGYLDAKATEVTKSNDDERAFQREKWAHDLQVLKLQVERERLQAAAGGPSVGANTTPGLPI